MIIDTHCHYGRSSSGLSASLEIYRKLSKEFNAKFMPSAFFTATYDDSIKEMRKIEKIVLENKDIFPGMAIIMSRNDPEKAISFAESVDSEAAKVLKPIYFKESIPIYSPAAEEIVKYSIKRSIPIFQHCSHEKPSESLQLGKLAEKYPKAKLILGHFGGSRLPFGETFENTLDVYKEKKNTYIDISTLFCAGCLEKAVKIDPNRILFATDYPIHYFSSHIATIKEADISEDVREKIFYENAVKLFNLGE